MKNKDIEELKQIPESGKMIEAVFYETMKQISEGKKPSISKIMREVGYSDSTARTANVTKSKTWEELKAGLDKGRIFKVFDDMIDPSNDDKRTRLAAANDLVKIYDLLPAQKLKIEEINEATEKFFKD